MANKIKMLFGHAEVELLQDIRYVPADRVIEKDSTYPYLCWARAKIFSITPTNGGYNIIFCDHGASGWCPETNVRNFKRLD